MTAQTYTAEQTAQLVEAYQLGASPETLAATLGRSVKSVVAKLAREGVYRAKTKAPGTGRVRKADLVARLAVATGASVESLETLEKANHEALETLVALLGA